MFLHKHMVINWV